MARDANIDIVGAEPSVVAGILSTYGIHKDTHRSSNGTDAAMTSNQVAEAYRATMTEHRMQFFDAVKTHRKALFWSAIMGLVSDKQGHLPDDHLSY